MQKNAPATRRVRPADESCDFIGRRCGHKLFPETGDDQPKPERGAVVGAISPNRSINALRVSLLWSGRTRHGVYSSLAGNSAVPGAFVGRMGRGSHRHICEQPRVRRRCRPRGRGIQRSGKLHSVPALLSGRRMGKPRPLRKNHSPRRLCAFHAGGGCRARRNLSLYQPPGRRRRCRQPSPEGRAAAGCGDGGHAGADSGVPCAGRGLSRPCGRAVFDFLGRVGRESGRQPCRSFLFGRRRQKLERHSRRAGRKGRCRMDCPRRSGRARRDPAGRDRPGRQCRPRAFGDRSRKAATARTRGRSSGGGSEAGAGGRSRSRVPRSQQFVAVLSHGPQPDAPEQTRRRIAILLAVCQG